MFLAGIVTDNKSMVVAFCDQSNGAACFAHLKFRMDNLGRVQDVIENLCAIGTDANAGEIWPKCMPFAIHLMAGATKRGVSEKDLFTACGVAC